MRQPLEVDMTDPRWDDLEPEDFKNQHWKEAAQAIKDGKGIKALLFLCKQYGDKAENYRAQVPAPSSIEYALRTRLQKKF